jgi:hypothetical protein
MNVDKMIKEILDERILNDGITAKGWKKYNDGIVKAVQVIREYQANGAEKSDSNCTIHNASKRVELLEAFLDEYIEAWEDGMAGSSSLLHDAKKLKSGCIINIVSK